LKNGNNKKSRNIGRGMDADCLVNLLENNNDKQRLTIMIVENKMQPSKPDATWQTIKTQLKIMYATFIDKMYNFFCCQPDSGQSYCIVIAHEDSYGMETSW
jgi:hypothetical protein